MSEPLTLGHFRELTKDLPDDTKITECDWDEANLHCYKEQIVLDGQAITFVPSKCYSLWSENDFEDTDKPIPEEWK